MKQMTPRELAHKLENISSLPSIPQVLLSIKQVTENPKSSAAELANCILSDHQLTSRILRMANSVHYGEFSGKINTVTHAIVLMGFRAVHNITISMAVYELVNKVATNSGFDTKAFWTRSLASGVISKYLALRIGKTKMIETAFIAGFMHDIGRAVLATAFPKQYDPIANLDPNKQDIYQTERAILGTDHMAAGSLLARQWNLPVSLVKSIANHHRIGKSAEEKSDNVLVDIVHLSDLISPHVLSSIPADAASYEKVSEHAMHLISITSEDMIELLEQCRQDVKEIAADFQIDIGDELDSSALHGEDVTAIHRELGNKEVQLAFLQNAASALSQAKSDDEVLQVICEALFRGLRMGRVILFEFNAQWEMFCGRVGFGVESQKEVESLSFSARNGMFRDLREKQNVISVVGDDREMYGRLLSAEDREQLNVSAFAVIPICVIDEVKYVLFVDALDRETPISDEHLRSISSLINQAAMTLERNLYKATSATTVQ